MRRCKSASLTHRDRRSQFARAFNHLLVSLQRTPLRLNMRVVAAQLRSPEPRLVGFGRKSCCTEVQYVSAGMSALGRVSRVSPVQTAVRNCTRDEGGPFGFGDQVADPKPPQAAVVKSHGGERCGNVGTMIQAGTVERGERKRTVSEVSKAD